jgi:hypothetical protein
LLASPRLLLAQPQIEEIFQSVRQNMTEPTDPGKLLAGFMLALGVIGLVVLLGMRRKRAGEPRVVNHHGKLLKELSRSVNLKPAELRQLRLLSDHAQVSSPLTLLLCPSILARVMRQKPAKVDARVVAQLARRLMK